MPQSHPEREYVAEQIKSAMKGRDLSLNGLADLTGIPPSSLSRYLRARTSPSLDHLAVIADALGTPLADLMPGCAA